MIVGLVDGGRFVYDNAALSQGAREGARVGAAEASWIGISGASGLSCVSSASGIGAGNPGAHVCPSSVAQFKADVITAVKGMAVSLDPTGLNVYISCNAGDSTDPVPSGPWTENAGGLSTGTPSMGNGCEDSSLDAVGGIGDMISVRIEYKYYPITPVISSLIPVQTLSASATMVIN
jgi:hypothetical protein